MTQCPECGDDTSLYECGECGVDHCVDCRLPDEHTCEPPETTTEADGRTAILGLSGKQWGAVVVLWFATVGSNPDITTAAGMVVPLSVLWPL